MAEKNYDYILSMENITKIYSNGFIANKSINFAVKQGEIHGLVGENGAGKSTLMKVLFGQEQPESGRIYIRGEEVSITSPLVALQYGIGMVHQHFMLVPSLTVAENMVFGIEPKKHGFFDYKKAIEMTRSISEKFALPIDPKMKIRDLNVGQKQRVEILKILMREVSILILDEPTAVLTPQETKELFVQLKLLKEKGYTIVLISHKLDEIKQICDRITVLRDGKSIATAEIQDVTQEQISQMIVGRNIVRSTRKEKVCPGEVKLSVRHLNHINQLKKQVLKDISFDLRKGEILGVAGVEGNGQKELSEIITRLDEIQNGKVMISGCSIKGKTIREIRNLSTAHISEDRMTYGTVSGGTIQENMISDRYYKKEYSRHGFLNRKKIAGVTGELIQDYQIKCDASDAHLKTLSGGNIQKVVAAREFSLDPELIIANQPTRGIDIGASELIRNKLIRMRDKGSAVLLISADLGELMEVSDSLIVLYNGEIVAYFPDLDGVSENMIGEYMLGLKRQTAREIGGACLEKQCG